VSNFEKKIDNREIGKDFGPISRLWERNRKTSTTENF